MVLGFGWSQEASKPDPPTRSGSLEFWSGMTSDEIFLEWANQTSAGVLAGWVRGVHENEVLDVFFLRRYLPLKPCIYNANPTQLVLLVYPNKQSSATAAWTGIIIPSLHSSEHMLCILASIMGGDITRGLEYHLPSNRLGSIYRINKVIPHVWGFVVSMHSETILLVTHSESSR